MRGKEECEYNAQPDCGITPARAGKRWSRPRRRSCAGDHPRACGEKQIIKAPVLGTLGSPPRVRGKVFFCLVSRNINGITPARAGKRSWQTPPGWVEEDHPRACGEKQVHGVVAGDAKGITPARAGKSHWELAVRADGEDHPRACGEKRTV